MFTTFQQISAENIHIKILTFLSPLIVKNYLFQGGQLCYAYLCWHDFSVTACDFDSSIKAGPVVSLNDITTVHLVGPHSTVVWTWKHNNQVRVKKKLPVT